MFIHLPTCNMSPSPSVLVSLAAAKYKTISSFLHWSFMLPVIYKFTSHQFLLKLNSFIHFYPSRFIKNSQDIFSTWLGRFKPAPRFTSQQTQGTPTASVRLPMWYKAIPCLGVARKAWKGTVLQLTPTSRYIGLHLIYLNRDVSCLLLLLLYRWSHMKIHEDIMKINEDTRVWNESSSHLNNFPWWSWCVLSIVPPNQSNFLRIKESITKKMHTARAFCLILWFQASQLPIINPFSPLMTGEPHHRWCFWSKRHF